MDVIFPGSEKNTTKCPLFPLVMTVMPGQEEWGGWETAGAAYGCQVCGS